jgi:hypothetical protein
VSSDELEITGEAVRRFEIDEGPNSLCLGAIVYATGGSAT